MEDVEVSMGGSSKSSILDWDFETKETVQLLGDPHLWKHPYESIIDVHEIWVVESPAGVY